MRPHSLKTAILLLLSFVTAGSVALSPLVSFGDDTRLLVLVKKHADADADDVEDSLELDLAGTVDPGIGLFSHTRFHAVIDGADHQIGGLSVRPHSARAPPQA